LNIRNQMLIKFDTRKTVKNNSRFLLVIFLLFYQVSIAQIITGDRFQTTQLAFDIKLQPSKAIKDSSGYSFTSQEYGASVFIPVFSKTYNIPEQDEPPKRFGIFLSPNVRINHVTINYLYDSRLLIHAGLGAGAYFRFKQKHTLSASVQSQVNEDEFTIYAPSLRYSGLVLYSHRSSKKFTYYLGATYTYLLGGIDNTGDLLPVIGTRFKMGEKSNIMVILPFSISYNKRAEKFRLNISFKPNGGVNRYENRLSFPTNNSELLLRRRSFVFAIGGYYKATSNLSIGAELGVLFARKLFFSSEDKTSLYTQNTIANGGQFTLKAIWRPWQNTLRNKAKQQQENGADDLIDPDLFIF
jgi:hypothetical protein